jgi:hypothetical protein
MIRVKGTDIQSLRTIFRQRGEAAKKELLNRLTPDRQN